MHYQLRFSPIQRVYLPFGGDERRLVWAGGVEPSMENVYYSYFVYGEFSKHKNTHAHTLRSPRGNEKLQIMETLLKDGNYRSKI